MSKDFITTKSYPVSGIPDEQGAKELLSHLQKISGVEKVSFNAEDRLVKVTFNEDITDDTSVRTVLDQHGHTIINPDRPMN